LRLAHTPIFALIRSFLAGDWGIPLAIGPFLAFRFRLWHYLVYTTLAGLELAYYLRQQ
jgi:hypothetical protein